MKQPPTPSHFKATILVTTLMLASTAPSIQAQLLRDYRCKIERVAAAEPLSGKLLDYQKTKYVGKEFTIDRRTGVISGVLTNTYITRPEVIDFGSED